MECKRSSVTDSFNEQLNDYHNYYSNSFLEWIKQNNIDQPPDPFIFYNTISCSCFNYNDLKQLEVTDAVKTMEKYFLI